LVKPGKNGSTKDQLEQIYSQTGIKPKQLIGPDFPNNMEGVWSTFLSLNDARTFTRTEAASMASAITYSEIKAFMEVTSTPISSREVSLIKSIDNIYLRIMNNG
jgi:hypothetical protein